MFLVQSDTTQFLAFFIHGPDGKPVWYVAIASPLVVGYLDIGFGKEKAALFSGIDYPF